MSGRKLSDTIEVNISNQKKRHKNSDGKNMQGSKEDVRKNDPHLHTFQGDQLLPEREKKNPGINSSRIYICNTWKIRVTKNNLSKLQ